MDLEDFIVSNNILPLGSVVFVMFCVSKYGWGWKNFITEADAGDGLKFPANVQKYMLYVIPAIVVVIYLKGYYDMFSPKGPVVLAVWMLVSLMVLGLVGEYVGRMFLGLNRNPQYVVREVCEGKESAQQ